MNFPRRDHRRRLWVTVAAIALLPLIVAIYANSLHGAFQYDDRHTIVDNQLFQSMDVRETIGPAWWSRQASVIDGGHYRPFTFATYAWNFAVGGLDPFGYHVVNVVLHWTATAALMALIWIVLPHPVPVIIAGVVFALNPANSEAVNYIAARSSVLASGWYALAIAGFALYRRFQAERRVGAEIAAAGLAVLGLLLGLSSKETAATIPLLWACYDIGWSRKAGMWRILQPYAVGLVLLIGYLAWTGYDAAIWAVLAGQQPPGMRSFGANAWTQISLAPAYLALFIWPFNLSVFHDVAGVASPWHLSVLWGAGVGVLTAGLGFRWLIQEDDPVSASADRERRAAGFFLLWFLAALLPTILYPLHAVFQEHRVYLPGMGLAALIGIGAWRGLSAAAEGSLVRRAVSLGVIVVLGVFAAATVARNGVWRDEVSLWSDAAVKAPNNAIPRINLGVGYARRGDAERAIAAYREALALSPNSTMAYHNLGTLHYGRGEYAPARQALEAAVGLDSEDMAALVTLGLVYDALGESGRADAVFSRAVRAVEERPELASARLAVADALAKSPRWRAAESHYRRLLAGPPAPHALMASKAHLGLGFLAERTGDEGAALASYQEAIRLDPALMDARFNAANLILRAGRSAEATAAYERMLKDDSRFFPARFNLGRLYEQAGRSDDARAQYRAFLDLAPPSPAYAAARAHAAARLGDDREGSKP